jgi:tRNA1Val (adenine37-N6)-methyltransferase
MKVGTDAMLLGSWVRPMVASSILDLGTGCGILALMMAQVSDAQIDAIDIHKPSVEEAGYNVSQSPWASRIHVIYRSLVEHARLAAQPYDIIISNPPFFINSLKPSSPRKLIAKHESTLALESLLEYSFRLMHAGSSLCLILPVNEGKLFTAMALDKGLFLARKLIVRPSPSKHPHRILIEFRFKLPSETFEDNLVILNHQNRFSEKYLSMTQNFHLFNQKNT